MLGERFLLAAPGENPFLGSQALPLLAWPLSRLLSPRAIPRCGRFPLCLPHQGTCDCVEGHGTTQSAPELKVYNSPSPQGVPFPGPRAREGRSPAPVGSPVPGASPASPRTVQGVRSLCPGAGLLLPHFPLAL